MTNPLVIAIVDILIKYHHGDRSTGGYPIQYAGENFNLILLRPGCISNAFTGASFIHFPLDVIHGYLQSGGATVDDYTDTLAVAFAEAGNDE